jgi:hypothetical protein
MGSGENENDDIIYNHTTGTPMKTKRRASMDELDLIPIETSQPEKLELKFHQEVEGDEENNYKIEIK